MGLIIAANVVKTDGITTVFFNNISHLYKSQF